jgi:hypothetical protein
MEDLPERVRDKRLKREKLAERALGAMERWRDAALAPAAAAR